VPPNLSPRTSLQNIWAGALIVIVALLPVGVQAVMIAHTDFLGDFGAFYCAARAVSHGADPYYTEPLRSCEHSVVPGLVHEKNTKLTIPAPLPGYTLAAFVPLSVLPFTAAATAWLILLLLAWAICIGTVVRFAGCSWKTVLAASSLSLGATAIPLGQIVPVAVAAICVAALFAWMGRWRLAAVAAAVSLIEPHLGLPVCVALAIWAPPTRIALGVSVAVLAAISLLAIGPATNLEYFTSVLPAHALSEAAFNMQYSLTSVLVSLGVADKSAVRVGSLWYFAMLALGVVVAGLLARKTGNRAFLVCAPPAFAVFGGVYVHETQVATALPVTLLFLTYAKAWRHTVAVLAFLLLAVLWRMANSPAVILAPAFPIGYLAARFWNGSLRAIALAAVATVLLFLGIDHAYLATPRQHPNAYVGSTIDPRFPEASWSIFLRANRTPSAASWIARIPTWSGLVLILGVLSMDAFERRRV
jgi:hypothetical protein